MTTLLTGPGRTNLLILAGMLWACGVVLTKVSGRPRERFGSYSGSRERIAFYGPPALIAAGFLLSGALNGPWFALTLALLTLLARRGRALLRRSTPADGPALGATLATLVLLEIGSLLAVRLVVVPRPDAPMSAAFADDALRSGFWSLVVPLGAVAAVLAVLGRENARARALWDRLVLRVRGIRVSAPLAVAVLVGVAVPFLLPMAGGDQATPLVFLGIATPEYGKLLLLAVIALVVAADRDFFDSSLIRRPAARWPRPAPHRTTMFMAKPLALLAVIVVASGLRSDFGTLVAALAATLGVTWAATWSHVADRPDFGSGRAPARFSRNLRRMAASYRLYFMIALPVLPLAVIGLFWTGYIGERGQVWLDPWAYRWGAGCVPVTPAGPDPGLLLPEHVIACQRSLLADTESQRSQVAAALSAVADGGLWGRGLADTASGRVPAGATDFVLAVIWNKLGGLAVLASAALIILLGVALVRAVRGARPGVNAPTLFVAGLAAMLVGQFLFVLSATVNLVPHSGVPAPLLSRGGQSTLTFLLGIVIALALAAEPVRAGPAAVQGRLWGPAAMAWCMVLAVAVTLVPYPAPAMIGLGYGQRRPPCPARKATVAGLTSPRPDAARCSTDEIAVLRTRIDIRFAGVPGFRQERPAGTWRRLDGGAMGELTVADLAGLLRVGSGRSGVLEQAYAEVLSGSAGTDLVRRLLPPAGAGEADGWLDLTIDPRLQHIAAAALRDPGADGSGPLAGGLVVLEARTGRILAAATAPAEPAPVASETPIPAEAKRSFGAEHRHYNRPSAGGALHDKQWDPTCASRTTDVARQRGCWLWSYVVPPPKAPDGDAELRRYVADDPAVHLPDPQINRAVGKRYGLGSTFKVIIAAAYLEQHPDADVDALVLPAPPRLALSDTVQIRNAGGGTCAGAEAELISLTWALAGSCNTAFVALARRLGWPAVATQAARFGLRVGSCESDDPVRLPGAVPSCVPATSDDVGIGNRALGGLDVSGTPLGLATVFAEVANDGRQVRPSLVAEVVDPSSGRRSGPVAGATGQVLSRAATEKLRDALRLTATAGTAAGLEAAAGTRLWVKTGTHELVPGNQPLPAGQFVRQNSWVAGWLDTPRGPVAFAVVLETRDQRAGGSRARHLIGTVAKAIAGSR